MEAIQHLDHVVAYNGEIIIFRISQGKASSDSAELNVLRFSRRRFNPDLGIFVETSFGQYSIQSSKSSITLARVGCVADTRTGIQLPYVLLKTCRRKSSCSSRLILLQVHTSNEVEPCLKFKVDSESLEDLCLIDGPTVIWRQHEKLFHISPLTSETLTAPVVVSAMTWTGTAEDVTYAFCTTKEKLDSEQLAGTSQHDETLQRLKFILYNIENQQISSGSCLVPHAYTSVLCSLRVCTMHHGNGKYETSAFGVTLKQLVWFQNGVPMRVCPLPQETLPTIQVAFPSWSDMLCVVSFASGNVCVISRDGWKTAASWQQVGRVLIDDFAGRGSDQMLLLFREDPRNAARQQTFRLTDCAEIDYPVDCKEKGPDNQYPENHLLMVQTLEARLQANLLLVEEMENHFHVQDRVLQSTCEALINMSLCKKTSLRSAEEENLVSLWDDTGNDPSATEEHSSPLDANDLVQQVWHRVVDDFLVVGVKLKDPVHLSLSDFGLSLIMDQEITSRSPVTKCRTNVLKLAISSSLCPPSLLQEEPRAKKPRFDCKSKATLPGNCSQTPCPLSYQSDLERTVTAVTELSSVLAFNNTSCALLLHARRKHQPGCLLPSEKLSIPCGRIPLSLEDVLKGKHTINVFECCQGLESLESVFTLLSAFQKSSLHILSPDCTLTALRVWLHGEMKAQPLTLAPEIMMCTMPGSLHGTLFIWSVRTPCEGTLTIFYRNNGCVLQCLHSLKGSLPTTCVVSVIREGSRDGLTRDFACSLEQELLALRNLTSAAAAEVEEELTLRCKLDNNITHTIELSTDSKDQVQKYREDLEKEQKQIKLGEPLTVHSELYRRNVQSLAHLQIDSNAFACVILKKFFAMKCHVELSVTSGIMPPRLLRVYSLKFPTLSQEKDTEPIPMGSWFFLTLGAPKGGAVLVKGDLNLGPDGRSLKEEWPGSVVYSGSFHINLTTQVIERLNTKGIRPKNFTSQQKAALKELEKNSDLIFKQADKGGNIVLMTRTQYEQMCNKILDNKEWYKKLQMTKLLEDEVEYNHILNATREHNIITKQTWEFLQVDKPTTQTFYTLPKIHKSPKNPPGRPIVLGMGSLTSKASEYVDSHLQPFVLALSFYVKYTPHSTRRHTSEQQEYYNSLYNINGSLGSPPAAIDEYITSTPLPPISPEETESLEMPFSNLEVSATIKESPVGKCPGPDGFTPKFYKHFEARLTPFLTRVFNSIGDNCPFPKQSLEATVSVLPKPGKDTTICGNYRPISIINIDLKLYAKTIAQRLQPLLPHWIHLDQDPRVPSRLRCGEGV
ncbi:Fanconi anemia group B protein [Gastrophryne carolinensis]